MSIGSVKIEHDCHKMHQSGPGYQHVSTVHVNMYVFISRRFLRGSEIRVGKDRSSTLYCPTPRAIYALYVNVIGSREGGRTVGLWRFI